MIQERGSIGKLEALLDKEINKSVALVLSCEVLRQLKKSVIIFLAYIFFPKKDRD